MDILLKASHFANYILDDLRGKLFKNLILGSSQDKGRYSLLEAFKGFDKGLSFLQFLRETLDVASEVLIVLLIEDGFFFEEAWHEEIEDAPQFAHLVLQWSASQD